MDTARRVLGVVALVLWIGAVVRVVVRLDSDTPPARQLAWRTASGPLDGRAGWPACHGSAFVEGDVVLRLCALPGADGRSREALVRSDLAMGTAEVRWPLPEGARGPIVGLARHPAGTLALLLADDAVYRVPPAGEATRLATLPAAVPVGLAWRGDAVEVVTGRWATAVHTLAPDGTHTTRTPPAPAADAARRRRVELAVFDGAAWRFVYSERPPVPLAPRPDELGPVRAELLCGREGNTPHPCGAVRLFEEHWKLEDGELRWRASPLERTRANLVNPGGAATLYRPGAEAFEALAPPPALDGQRRADDPDYQLTAAGLRELTRWIDEEGTALDLGGTVVGLAERDGAPALFRFPDAPGAPRPPGPALATAGALDGHVRVLPASRGGVWVLGARGAYVRAGADLRRADPLARWERLARLVRSFDERAAYDDFYASAAFAKLAAATFVVAGLPFALLVALTVALWRARGAAAYRRWALAAAQAIYVALAAVALPWFWRLSADL